MPDVFIGGDDDGEACLFGCRHYIALAQFLPSKFVRVNHIMSADEAGETDIHTVVKQNSHL
jgi:hypothetical protein